MLIMQILPPQLRFSPGDVKAAAMWGATAAVGAIWLVQVMLVPPQLLLACVQ